MANTLKFKRGLVGTIPTAAQGEPLFTTDTFDLYIGNGTGNTRFQKFIASGTTSQLLRGDGSLLTMPIVLTSPANGQVLKYNGTNWVNDSDAGITGSGVSGQVSYWNGTNTQTGSNNFFWDAANNRLGVGTNTPSVSLDVNGIAKIQNIRIDGSNLDNTFIGKNTWASNTGLYNTFIGSGAGNNNTSGYAGTFLGYNAGIANTTGIANTFIGYQSGIVNTTGTGNTFLGVDAGYGNVVSNYNVIIGFHAGLHADVSENVLIGADTAQTLGFSGLGSVYVGYRTGFSATTANYNTFIGSLAGFSVTTGDNLTLIGREAGQALTSGSDTTIIGYRAGFNQTAADGNTMLGSFSGFSNAAGNQNTYVGKDAAYYVTTGNNNTISGFRSGYNITTGSDNTFIGAFSGSSVSQLVSASNSVAIGYNAFTSASNQVVIGNALITHNILYGNLLLGSTTNGTQRLQVTGDGYFSGSVGIGVSPNNKLSISVPFSATNDTGVILSAQTGVTSVASISTLVENVSTGATAMLFSTLTANGSLTEKMRLTNGGNLGLGVTPSAWGSSNKALQLPSGSVWSLGNQFNFGANVYDVSTGGYKYTTSTFASYYRQLDGTHAFFTAPTGTAGNAITFTQAMTLDASGRLLLGSGSVTSELLQVNGTMRVTGASTFSSSVTATSALISNYRLELPSMIIGYWDSTNNRIESTTRPMFFTSYGSGNNIYFGFDGSYGAMTLHRATSNTHIGGTTDTGEKLQVTGTMRVSGASTFATDITVNQITVGKGGGNVASNTVVGLAALASNTTGSRNSSFGISSMASNTTGVFNSAFGYDAMRLNVSGNSNSAFGQSALYTNSGSENVAIGLNALYNSTSGNYNVAIGVDSGRGTNANTTGSNNIFIGYASYGVSATESNRTWIGNTSTTSTWLGGRLLLGSTTDDGVNRLQVTGAATFSSSVTAASYTINDAGNITIGTTTGTKIGTATSQKIGFWNATPIVQPTTAVAAAAFVANTGTAVNDASTFDGYTMAQVVKALRNAGLLA